MSNGAEREMSLKEWVATLPESHRARRELAELEAKQELAQRTVALQAENEGLWFVAQTAPEAYLQGALRDLHAVIEA